MQSEYRILVFLPKGLAKNDIGFIRGFTINTDNTLAFYVLEKAIGENVANSIGYCSEQTPEDSFGTTDVLGEEWLHINSQTGQVKINNLKRRKYIADEVESMVTIVEYDYERFKECETMNLFTENYGEHFQALIEAIKNKEKRKTDNGMMFLYVFCSYFVMVMCKLLNFVKPLSKYSAVIEQLEISINTWKWILMSKESKCRITVVNILVAKLVDFLVGLFVLFAFLSYQTQISSFVSQITEDLIDGIKELLIILMGSPVGLKLNYHLSQNLGLFFMYHISLWEAFLQTTQPLLHYSVYLLIIPGALGLSYQAALLSDIIAFSSFHVYCIYVYAARLYGFQIHGIVSLWRLFLGRKYNPLRHRVDSYQYSNNQLFIGILGFTLLLFLLPTMTLYYMVFTALRLGFKATNGLLLTLRYVLHCLPVYVVSLWLVRSPKIAGSVFLKLERSPFSISATLKTLSLWSTISHTTKGELMNCPKVSWGLSLSSIFSGSLF